MVLFSVLLKFWMQTTVDANFQETDFVSDNLCAFQN